MSGGAERLAEFLLLIADSANGYSKLAPRNIDAFSGDGRLDEVHCPEFLPPFGPGKGFLPKRGLKVVLGRRLPTECGLGMM